MLRLVQTVQQEHVELSKIERLYRAKKEAEPPVAHNGNVRDNEVEDNQQHGKTDKIKKMRKARKKIREIMAETGLSKASVYRALEA